jgi:hypothetical protein
MEQTFFLFLQITAFFFFLYGIERDSWHGLLIFLSSALFLALSLASFDIQTTHVLFNETSGEIAQYTVTAYDTTYAYINGVMGLFSIALGVIKTVAYKETLKPED